jgi:hypothetical protein
MILTFFIQFTLFPIFEQQGTALTPSMRRPLSGCQPVSEQRLIVNGPKPVLLLLITTRENVQCPVCRNAFLQLYEVLDRFQSSLELHCVVQIDPFQLPATLETDEAIRILESQIRGFFKSMGSNFLLYTDTSATIRLPDRESPFLIMLHRPFQIIKKWQIPLHEPDMNELTFFLHATGG